MATKRVSLMSDVVLPLIVYAATIVLFFVFKPAEPKTLFWVNFGYTLFLETGAFGWLFWVKKDRTNDVSPLMSVIFGTYGVYYTIAGVAVMLLYTILVNAGVHIGMRWYVAAIIVITVLWIIPAFFMVEADSTHKQDTDTVKRNTQEIRNLSAQMKTALNQASNLTPTQKTRLQQEFDSIAPSRLNADNVTRLIAFMNQVQFSDYDYLISEIKNIKTTL